MRYAQGKNAFGYCDVCGFRFPLAELKKQVVAGRIVNQKACPECWDEDNPQLLQGRDPVFDPQALYEPRPDLSLLQSRAFFGWNPVGCFPSGLGIALGTVTVTTT